MSKYIPVIGMEIHVEPKTDSKMFCSCKNGMGLEKEPNVDICPVCTAQPGTLPFPNQKAIEFVQLAGLALDCELRSESKFDRKNYFYPDIPKGYQISQYDQPFCQNGVLEIPNFPLESGSRQGGDKSKIQNNNQIQNSNIQTKKIGITRIHLEEDTGKLVHPKGANYSLVDFNRAGVPLMELVTEPDIESGAEARLFCQKLQQICRYLGISDADMEKGHMRCEVNLSLHQEDEERLSGTKVEVKNINSFRFVEKAVEYEIRRQTEILDKGEKVIQETRGFNGNRNITVSQRKKESAHDYRYFPEPDIPPLRFNKDYLNSLKQRLPELPEAKKKRMTEEYQLSQESVEVITGDKNLADYYEAVVSELEEKVKNKETAAEREKCLKLAANYIANELQKHLIKNYQTIADVKITPENYAEFIGIVAEGKINSSAAQAVLEEMYRTGGDPSQIIDRKGLMQMNDEKELEGMVDRIIAENQKSVEDYRHGKQNALQFLMGKTMSESKGKANPAIVINLLKKKLVNK